MMTLRIGAIAIVLGGLASAAQAASAVMVEHDWLSISADGSRVANVEAKDPGNLPEPAHGAVVVRAANGRVLATYDPCGTCTYSDTAFSVRGDLAFLATDYKTHITSLYAAPSKGDARAIYAFGGYGHTVRYSPDGARIAVLATIGARKRPGAIEAGAALVGQIGEADDEQRLVVMPAAKVAGDGKSRFVSPADTYIYEYDWTPDGRGFAATAAKGNGDNNWWVAKLVRVDIATGGVRAIAAPKMQMNLPRVSPDGQTVAFIGGIMSDLGSIGGDVYTVPIDGGEPRNNTPSYAGTFNGLSWAGGALMTSAIVDDRTAAVRIDVSSGRTQVMWSAQVNTDAQRYDGDIVFSRDGRVAAARVQDFNHPQEIAVGRLPNLASVTRDNAGLPAHVAFQSVHWRNDQFRLQGWLLGPKQVQPDRNYPMLVIVHGGPSSSVAPHYVADRQYGVGVDFVYDLISRGYYVFYPNDRGSYGQGDAFTRANVRDFGRGDFRDMMAGVDTALKVAPIDDKRLVLYGASYGGWFAMWANTQTNRFKAIVAGAGISNWSSYYGTNGIDRWMIPFFGTSYYDDPAAYRAASPIEYIKGAHTPTLLFVGERDVECPPTQSIEYWHALRAMGTPTELVIYPGQGHRIRDQKALMDIRARSVRWIEKYIDAQPAVR